MPILKIIKRIFSDAFFITLLIFVITPFSTFHGDLAEADQFDNEGSIVTYPYLQTFTISAYYSPLPCQNKYATGSFEGDVRLNGEGVHSADGSIVYPGMIAAPKTYPFGTKMQIPGIGIVAVHDRGGAIVASSGQEGFHDRLDVWMGYGDKGLERALNWGKRTLEVTVYGINGGIVEQIALENYSNEEAIPNECNYNQQNISQPEIKPNTNIVNSPQVPLTNKFSSSLQYGDSGESVKHLQEQLKKLNYYKADITGQYDELTKHAVLKFQQSQSLVIDENSSGAGIFGPKTQEKINEILNNNDLRNIAVYEKNKDSSHLVFELDFGITNEEVKKLQVFLKDKGYFTSSFVTTYFGPITKEALMNFQLDNGIIKSKDDSGAGRVGPSTLRLINSMI